MTAVEVFCIILFVFFVIWVVSARYRVYRSYFRKRGK